MAKSKVIATVPKRAVTLSLKSTPVAATTIKVKRYSWQFAKRKSARTICCNKLKALTSSAVGCDSPSIITFPEPFGVMLMLPFDAETIELPLTSKSPPSCGVTSPTTSVSPAVIDAQLLPLYTPKHYLLYYMLNQH